MSIAQIRQRGAKNFDAYYQSLCALEGTTPISSVLAGAKLNALKCNASQLRTSDWHPLLAALQINTTFHEVAVYKKWDNIYLSQGIRSGMHCKTDSRGPDKDTISAIVRSVKECMCVSSTLKSLTIEGIGLRTKDILLLSKGLSENNVLTHFSLKGSRLGDKGVEIICGVLKQSQCLDWLDLTACDIGHKGTMCLSGLIRFQCTARQTAAWKGSLRHHYPNLTCIQGLRRLTLNLNRNIGDRGALELSNALMDDKWIRALDLQSCGISTDGAVGFSEALRLNSFLVIVDLRDNELIDDDILDDISDHLTSNAVHMNTEQYSQLDLEVERIASQSKPSAPSSAITRKAKHTCIKPSTIPGAVGRAPKPGARKISVRKCGTTKLYSCQRTLSSSSLNRRGVMSSKPKPHSVGGFDEATCSADKMATKIRSLKVELLTCKRKLHEESVARSIAESRLLQLEVENRTLSEQLKKIQEGDRGSLDDSGTVMVNKDTIEVVETAFQHFHKFLDTLSLTSKDTSVLHTGH